MTLTFSEAMDTASVPAAGDFTLAGTADSVNIQADQPLTPASGLRVTG